MIELQIKGFKKLQLPDDFIQLIIKQKNLDKIKRFLNVNLQYDGYIFTKELNKPLTGAYITEFELMNKKLIPNLQNTIYYNNNDNQFYKFIPEPAPVKADDSNTDTKSENNSQTTEKGTL